MENKLTSEEQAKIFAMYLGCEVMLTEEPESINEPYVVNAINIGGYFWTDADDESGGQAFELGKLLLTPLSKITDEHAIEMAGSIFDKKYWLPHYSTKADHEKVTTEMINQELLKQIKPIIKTLSQNPGFGWYEGAADALLNGKDYLISKSYALPIWFSLDHWANGKTAIDLGIAIDKTIQ